MIVLCAAMKKPLGQGYATVLEEALDTLYTILSVTHNQQCPRTSPDLLCGFHDFMTNCDNLTLQLKSYALMALACHVDVNQKEECAPALGSNGKGTVEQPLISCSYCEVVCKEGRFEMMYEAIQRVLKVSGPFTCALLTSALFRCRMA